MDTPIGIIKILAKNDSLLGIDFVQEKSIPEKRNAVIECTIAQLKEYFKGLRQDFDLPLALSGTTFQKKVWRELMKIPYGETLSYGEIARRIDNPRACRAVGNANNRNKIAILIPCHRVIGANGALVGYGGELWRKKWLLEHERRFKNT